MDALEMLLLTMKPGTLITNMHSYSFIRLGGTFYAHYLELKFWAHTRQDVVACRK